MTDRRDRDELARFLAQVERRVAQMERGSVGTVIIPAGHPCGAPAVASVLGVPLLMAGPVSGQMIWTVVLPQLGSSTAVSVRVESAGAWTLTAGATRIVQTETAVTAAIHSATGGWTGALSLSNGGGTPTTACLLWLKIDIGGADEVRVITTGIVSS